MKPLVNVLYILLVLNSGFSFGQNGADSLLKAQVDAHLQQGMKGHRLKDDVLWVKVAGQNFHELIQLLVAKKESVEYVDTEMFGEKTPEDLILFAKDRLIELAALKLDVCKGQPITIRESVLEEQEKTLVGPTRSLPCGKLAQVRDWKNARSHALKYCDQGEIKLLTSTQKGYGPHRASASAPIDSLAINLFCFEETEIRIKNEFPEFFSY